MNGRIYAFITCTRVKWEATVEEYAKMAQRTEEEVRAEWEGDTDYNPEADIIRLEDPIEEHGWIDRARSYRVLHDSRDDVNPAVSCDLDNAYDLHEEVKDALEWLEGGYRDNGDGTFYASDSYQPFDEAWSYSYALHFVRKCYTGTRWVEVPWTGALDCLKNAGHNAYPHTPGTLYGCQVCEEECFREEDFTCVSCAIESEEN